MLVSEFHLSAIRFSFLTFSSIYIVIIKGKCFSLLSIAFIVYFSVCKTTMLFIILTNQDSTSARFTKVLHKRTLLSKEGVKKESVWLRAKNLTLRLKTASWRTATEWNGLLLYNTDTIQRGKNGSRFNERVRNFIFTYNSTNEKLHILKSAPKSLFGRQEKQVFVMLFTMHHNDLLVKQNKW